MGIMTPHTHYNAESIGSVMSARIPTCYGHTRLREVFAKLTAQQWDSVRQVYVIDTQATLLGFIDIATLIQADHEATAQSVMRPIVVWLHVNDDQEKAVYMAVKDDVVTIPVVDDKKRLLGAVTAHAIIDVMHAEHIEDALLTAGIRGKGSPVAKLAAERTGLLVKNRAPWLIGGLAAGLGLGLISSLFEHALQSSIALAYFIPVVAYIADSVGTQSEAIVVRALATVKINFWQYAIKELFVGAVLGVIVGILGGLGALLISHEPKIGLVVALSLFVASTVATVVAASIPILFKARGKDPALGSGPLATAIQDIISVIIYFVFATLIM